MDRYYRFPSSGAVMVRSVEGDDSGQPDPPGAVEITSLEYATELTAIQVADAAYIAGLRATEQAHALADYLALIAAGLPVATALRLSGHVPDDPDDGPDLPLPLLDGEAG